MSFYTGCFLLKKKKTSLESASVDERFPISSGSLNLVKVLVNDVKQHSLEREIKTQSVMQKQDDIGKTDSLQGVIKERDVQIWSCNHVKQLLSSSPATPCSLAASNTGGQWPKERDELINGRERQLKWNPFLLNRRVIKLIAVLVLN